MTGPFPARTRRVKEDRIRGTYEFDGDGLRVKKIGSWRERWRERGTKKREEGRGGNRARDVSRRVLSKQGDVGERGRQTTRAHSLYEREAG